MERSNAAMQVNTDDLNSNASQTAMKEAVDNVRQVSYLVTEPEVSVTTIYWRIN